MRFLSLPPCPPLGGLYGRALRLHGAMWPNGTQRGSGGDLVNSIETQSVYEHRSGAMRTVSVVTVLSALASMSAAEQPVLP